MYNRISLPIIRINQNIFCLHLHYYMHIIINFPYDGVINHAGSLFTTPKLTPGHSEYSFCFLFGWWLLTTPDG